MRLTGNKGEWSELYALLKLLVTGRLYAADENARRIDNTFFPVLRILKNSDSDMEVDFVLNNDDVEIFISNVKETAISKEYLSAVTRKIFDGIVQGNESAFEIEGSKEILEMLHIDRISAPPTDKIDITIQIHDIYTGYEPICGFSIKSEMGSPPTLLNASGATNFVFEIQGITDADMERINSIETKTKILDRVSEICKHGSLKFHRVLNDTFSSNLLFIDSYMDDILAAMLLDYYQNKATECKDLVDLLEKENPLGYPRKGFYEYKIKKFLCSVALGMVPSKEWSGRDDANGGYVIVKDDGDVLAYYLYNRDAFETYLLNNTKLERGSITKHKFATIYKNEKGRFYVNFNLQIRFT